MSSAAPDADRPATDLLESIDPEEVGPVDASWLAHLVLADSTQASDVRAGAEHVDWGRFEGMRKQRVDAWFAEAGTVLSDPRLDPRRLLIALALRERRLGLELVRVGVFHLLLRQGADPLELFNAKGRECLDAIPRSRIGMPIEPIVLRQPDFPGRRGGLSADGTRAVGYAEDANPNLTGPGLIALWHVESGHLIARLETPSPVRSARFTSDGRFLRALLNDGRILEWSTSDPARRGWHELTPPIAGMVSGALSADASTACARLASGGFVVFEVSTGVVPSPTDPEQTIHHIRLSPDGEKLAFATRSGGELRDWRTGRADPFDLPPKLRTLECTSSTAYLSNDRGIFLAGERTGSTAATHAPRMSVDPDGSLLAYVDALTGVLVLIQPETSVELGRPPADPPIIRSTFALKGRRLLTCHRDGSLRVWDVGLEPAYARLPPAPYDSDRADEERDLLDRSRDVDAFASLITAKSVTPPLSIGIFANWGGGKSWFMSQLRRRVAAIAMDAADSGRRQSELSFYKRVAQVHFNAWHYSESDVLASLVDHIVNRLELSEPADAATRSLRDAVQAVATADKEATAASKEFDKAAAELAARESERLAAEDKRAAEAERLRNQLTQDDSLEAARSAAATALRQMGWGDVPDAAADLVDIQRRARASLAASRSLLAPQTTGDVKSRQSARRWTRVFLLLGPVLALVVGGLLALAGEEARAALAGLGALVAGAAAGLAGLVRRYTTWLTDGIQRLNKAEADIETEINDRLKGLNRDVLDARSKELAARTSLAPLSQAKVEKLAALEERTSELVNARPETSLQELLADRIRTGAYSSRLGLIAQARRDFEDVSDLIGASNARLETLGAVLEDEKNVKVSRIVLYIDDLDRCEPVKVAQVLQAVHLLLAFPVFVVVVGVDPRWVGRALRKYYPELLDDSEAGVTAEEYLEKIFQIPYWLEHLRPEATEAMLTGLAEAAPSTTRRVGGYAEAHPPPVPDEPHADVADSPPAAPAADGSDPKRDRMLRSRDLNPEGLRLEPHETAAMSKLAPILGRSPRAVKRFVNLYRLLKVRADDSKEFAHEGRPDSDYLVVLYLLAEITGRPERAGQTFAALRALPPTAVVSAEIAPDLPDGWPTAPASYQAWLDDVAQFSFTLIGRPTAGVKGVRAGHARDPMITSTRSG